MSNSEYVKNYKPAVFKFLEVMAVLLMIVSIVVGGFIIQELGTVQQHLAGDVYTTEANYIAVFSGIAVVVQGLAVGSFMMAFSFLSVKLINKV